jgi:hypothetical protein
MEQTVREDILYSSFDNNIRAGNGGIESQNPIPTTQESFSRRGRRQLQAQEWRIIYFKARIL